MLQIGFFYKILHFIKWLRKRFMPTENNPRRFSVAYLNDFEISVLVSVTMHYAPHSKFLIGVKMHLSL